jgi:hypothetical protein
MKIELEEEGIEICTDGLLERLYLERLGLKYEGDKATCVVTYEGSYICLDIQKVTEQKVEDKKGEVSLCPCCCCVPEHQHPPAWLLRAEE